MTKNDITNRSDIYTLVSQFYSKVKSNTILGPIFNTAIQDWDKHIEQLTTFWQSSLFLNTKYTGNPIKTHITVDQNNQNNLTQMHFGIWLNLWLETIDQLYTGPIANTAKNKARKMSSFIFLKIFEARKNQVS